MLICLFIEIQIYNKGCKGHLEFRLIYWQRWHRDVPARCIWTWMWICTGCRIGKKVYRNSQCRLQSLCNIRIRWKGRYTQNLPKKFQNNIETIQTQFKMTGKFKRLMKKYFQQRTRWIVLISLFYMQKNDKYKYNKRI